MKLKLKKDIVVKKGKIFEDISGETDYTVLKNDIKVEAKNDIEDECDLEIQNADIKHSLALFKEELSELIETYIQPFLK